MTDDPEFIPSLDPEDALEAKLRLGVLASSILESAHILCTEIDLLRVNAAGRVLKSSAADFQALAAAMEVLERRSIAPVSRTSAAPRG